MKIENVKTAALPGIVILILSSFIVLASCTPAAPVIETTAVANTTTTQQATTTALLATITTPQATTTAPPLPTTEAVPTTTVVTTTTVKQKDVYRPVMGVEFPEFNREQEKWIIVKFDYDTIPEPVSGWQFPWSLTITNKTETDLELMAYIVYIGYHDWVGHITKTPFELKGGETKTLSGEDILSDALVEQIAYIREAILVPYVIER